LVTTVLVAVSRLCAFLCLTKQPERFPSPSFAPFAGCNSLSVFTAIVEDWVPMRLAVLPLCEMSPLSGEPRWRFPTGPIIAQPFDNGTWLTSKDDLVLGLNELGMGKLESPASTMALLSELVQSVPKSDESSPTL
jgi:hypothetical protein